MNLAGLPKAVLHDHLDGGLRVETIIDLARRQGYAGLPVTDGEGLADWFDQGRSGSLERYLRAFRHTIGVMRSREAVERVAYEAVVDLAADGVVYAELRFAPTLLATASFPPPEVVEAALAGMRSGEADTGIVTGLILCAMRDGTDSLEVARLAVAMRGEGVVAFDLVGPERGHPADSHLPACRYVREASMSLTLHAGEADGPPSIWRALHRCGAHRIGHGVRIMDDCRVEDGEIVALGSLASYVRDHRVPLEICVTSNLHTGGYAAEQHPLGALHRAGFAVTLNPDNRLMSRTSMTGEFELAMRYHGFEIRDLRAVTETAMQAAFCPLPLRERLLNEKIRPGYPECGSA